MIGGANTFLDHTIISFCLGDMFAGVGEIKLDLQFVLDWFQQWTKFIVGVDVIHAQTSLVVVSYDTLQFVFVLFDRLS